MLFSQSEWMLLSPLLWFVTESHSPLKYSNSHYLMPSFFTCLKLFSRLGPKIICMLALACMGPKHGPQETLTHPLLLISSERECWLLLGGKSFYSSLWSSFPSHIYYLDSSLRVWNKPTIFPNLWGQISHFLSQPLNFLWGRF